MGFILLWMGIFCIVVPFLIGAVIHFGTNHVEKKEDYMVGDDEFDWGDKP